MFWEIKWCENQRRGRMHVLEKTAYLKATDMENVDGMEPYSPLERGSLHWPKPFPSSSPCLALSTEVLGDIS